MAQVLRPCCLTECCLRWRYDMLPPGYLGLTLLPSGAKKLDSWQARLRLTISYQVIIVYFRYSDTFNNQHEKGTLKLIQLLPL